MSKSDKKLVKEMTSQKAWHHDIKFIDKEFVEEVVHEAQNESDEGRRDTLMSKIIANYKIFRRQWGTAFRPYVDELEDGESIHDFVVFKAASQFDFKKGRKANGRAFNAYLVSSLLHQLRNLRNAKMSAKNHPRIKCPICGEETYQIDQKHLEHLYTLDRYVKDFPDYPVSAYGPSEQRADEEASYTVDEFYKESEDLRPSLIICPVTKVRVAPDEDYLLGLYGESSQKKFFSDFPDFEGGFDSPYTGEKMLFMTQRHLDDNAVRTTKPKMVIQVPVYNPYTDEEVWELTPKMLSEAGTTVKDHLTKYAKFYLDKKYFDHVVCPFTGKKTQRYETDKHLKRLGKTPMEFYLAVCEYPFSKFLVRCALCGDYVENVWDHLTEARHRYAPYMDMQTFEGLYGQDSRKLKVTTNSYVDNGEGESIHVGELASATQVPPDNASGLCVRDSLLAVAEDDMDRKIAESCRDADGVEDILYMASERREVTVKVKGEYSPKKLKAAVKEVLKTSEYDVASNLRKIEPNKKGEYVVTVSTPTKKSIMNRLRRMVESSDLSYDIPTEVD